MNQSDIAALMKGVAPVIRDFLLEATSPLVERIGELEQQLAAATKPVDHSEAIATAVAEAIAKLPAPADGKDADPEEIERLVNAAVANLPAPKDGAPGKLPTVKAWVDEVHYEGAVVTHAGSTYQASKDTGREPPHADWTCLAKAGTDGAEGRGFTIRGTYEPDPVDPYRALHVVALNGASFAAKKDDPGPCPGGGWQLLAAQGKRGKEGETRKGDPGRPGNPGAPVVAATIDDNGMLTLTNGDGSTVDCDLYPLLSRLASTKP